MSFKISNLKSLTDELICRQCNRLLSVLPVYYCAATGNVCGRCSNTLDWMISNGTLERAVAYEAVAKHLLFPCYNKANGCKAELKWNQVEEHEKSCVSTVLLCPFNAAIGEFTLQCDWKGNITEMVAHLHADHQHNLQVNPPSFIMNVQESNLQLYLVKIAEETFIIFTKYLKDTNKFYCMVMCCARQQENQFFRYQLELGRYNDYFLILRKSSTEPFVNTSKIIDDYDKMITVDVASVEGMLCYPGSLIYCKVGIVKKSKKELCALMEELKMSDPSVKTPLPPAPNNQASTANGTTKNPPSKSQTPAQKLANAITSTSAKITTAAAPQKPKLAKVKAKSSAAATNSSTKVPEKPKIVKQLSKMDKQLLEELECPICNNYMVPPIFICSAGHSLCTDCMGKVQECPSCRIPVSTSSVIRNFTLEKITACVQYPCKFTDIGCTEMFNSEQIRKHENTCVYSSNKCPLKMLPSICNLKKDPVDIIGHIRQHHSEYIAEVNQEYSRNIKAQVTSSYYVAIQDKDIFIVCCKHSTTTGPIKFNFLHVGMKTVQPKYRYELEFLDQTDKGLKLVVNQLCQMVPTNINLGFKNCLAIPLEMLDPFITKKSQPTLFFKFHLEKI